MQVVVCPNKKCKHHKFATEKEEPQCGICGLRFTAVNHILNVNKSQNLLVNKEHKNQIKEIGEKLEKLSSKHEETGIAIKKIRKIAGGRS